MMSLHARRGLVLAVVSLAGATVWFWLASHPHVVPLYVAAPRPFQEGATREAAGVSQALRLAVIRTFAGLEDVYVLDSHDVNELSEQPPAELARAVAADEVLITRLLENGYRIELERFSRDGSSIWSDTFDLPTREAGLALETAVERLQTGFRDRPQRKGVISPTASPEDYSAVLQIRQDLQEHGRLYLPTVLDQLREIRERSPALVEAYTLEVSIASYLFRTTGNRTYLNHARSVLAHSQTQATGDPRLLRAAADLALASNDLEAATAAISKLTTLAPLLPSLRRYQARLAEARGDLEEAVEILETAFRERPSASYLRMLADVEMRLGRMSSAKQHLVEALELAPNHLLLKAELGELELRHGSPAQARKMLLQVVSRSPRPNYLLNLGTAILLDGDYQEAADCYRQALRALGSESVEVLVNLADAYNLIGDSARASALYCRVAERRDSRQSNEQAAITAYCLARCGDSTQAIRMIEEILARAPRSPDITYLASLVYLIAKQIPQACALRNRSLELGCSKAWFSLPWFDVLTTCNPTEDERRET
jgi:tetratricopeptide (TPR) repeat protein